MFRSRIIISTAFTLAASIFWFSFLYQKPNSQPLTRNTYTTTKEARQNRNNVRKDLWIAQTPTERVCNRIESDHSLLVFRPKGNSMELFEQLTGIRCWIQEKTSTNGQQVRFFVAKEGLYRYQGQQFEARDVFLSMYKLSTAPFSFNLTNNTPFMQGTAERVTFSLQNGAPAFQAHKFQASLGAPKQARPSL